ncbi:MAG: APC family permease [Thermoleophilia bacterium]
MPGKTDTNSMGFLEATAIGIGGMVGGGIFAVLGLAVHLSGGGAPVAFLIAGMVALVTAHSYAKLSVTFPSQGGTVEFINQAFGEGIVSGGLNILLWMSYVVMLSLYAHAFGSYAASFFAASHQALLQHLFLSLALVTLTLLNLMGARQVGAAEELIVAMKLIILSLFVAVGVFGIHTSQLAVSTWAAPISLLAGGMVIFVAYEGFELIANSAQDIRQPEKNLPRAFYASVLLVVVLYVAVAAVTVGTLSLDQVAAAQDYVLAEAARPILGAIGFGLVGLAAMLSTASAINATLYGTARVSYIIAKEGELPAELERKVWRRPVEGLLITSGLTLLVANLLDLTSIAAAGSSGFLLIFAAVNIANFRLSKKTGGRRPLSLAGVIACLGALAAMLWQVAQENIFAIAVIAAMLVLSFAIEIIYRRISGRCLRAYYRIC